MGKRWPERLKDLKDFYPEITLGALALAYILFLSLILTIVFF